jgi:ABC-type ATPase with predicted acetyltransferase domain
MSDRRKHPWFDLRRGSPPPRTVVDCFPRRSLESTLQLLAGVGLADAQAWLRPANRLSDGQQFRFRLARAIDFAERASHPVTLVCDEFAALLDRVTACVVAASLRRTIDRSSGRLAAIVATSHDDIERPLKPDVVVRCDFGVASVTRRDVSGVPSGSGS